MTKKRNRFLSHVYHTTENAKQDALWKHYFCPDVLLQSGLELMFMTLFGKGVSVFEMLTNL